MTKKITAKVIKGRNVGQSIGFPTANLDKVPSEKDLKPGVYASECWISPSPFSGDLPAETSAQAGGLESETSEDTRGEACLAYFGPRLIFGESKNVFEVHLLNFSGDLYGQTLTVKIGKFIRAPKKIKNLEELKEQLEEDKRAV